MNPVKRIILISLSKLFPTLGNNGAVLMYHSIGENNLFFTTKTQDFERQMSYLQKNNYQVIPLKKMIERIDGGLLVKNCVAITFDDGYEDFKLNALPILEKYNFPATVFIITGKLGEELKPTGSNISLKTMSADEIKQISRSTKLVDFMPHTQNHTDLTRIDFDKAVDEIESSRKDVENLTGKKTDIFAYPKGKYTSRLYEYLKNSGNWFGAVTVRSGIVNSKNDCFTLNRISVDSTIDLNVFKSKLTRATNVYHSLNYK